MNFVDMRVELFSLEKCLFFLCLFQRVQSFNITLMFAVNDSDEFYEWLIWKIAQKYDVEHGNSGLEKRVNWNALK